jgi:hypothetical protein
VTRQAKACIEQGDEASGGQASRQALAQRDESMSRHDCTVAETEAICHVLHMHGTWLASIPMRMCGYPGGGLFFGAGRWLFDSGWGPDPDLYTYTLMGCKYPEVVGLLALLFLHTVGCCDELLIH